MMVGRARAVAVVRTGLFALATKGAGLVGVGKQGEGARVALAVVMVVPSGQAPGVAV